MKIFRCNSRWFTPSGSIIIASIVFLGWGALGHKIINKAGARNFPEISIMTSSIIQRLTDSAAVPDSRSGYEPKHYMDMDALPEYATMSITHNRDLLFEQYGESYIRNSIGFLPWVIDSVMSVLTEQMHDRNWNRAWSTAADLGHYIADAHQPLHATKYYNGNTGLYGSGSYGIHSRYETEMIKNYQSSLIIDSTSVSYISSPLDTTFSIMYESCSFTDSILIADFNARQYTGSSSNSAYYAALWQRLGFMTKRQFQRASVAYGSFLYSAWVNAGSPSTFVEGLNNHISDFRLEQNYPNPFNPTTVISYHLPNVGTQYIVSLKVYDIIGREVANLGSQLQETGKHLITFNAQHLSSGIYIYRIEAMSTDNSAHTFVESKKMILIR